MSTLSLSRARLFPAAREGVADGRSDAWVRPALIAVTVLAAFLYCWHLSINGYANTYYSAAAPRRVRELEGVVLRIVRRRQLHHRR